MPGSRISNTGQPQARNDATLDTARSGSSVTENGMTVGEWLCTTAMTSGRALKASPWMNRSRNMRRSSPATGLESRSSSMMSAAVTSAGARAREIR